ncbi:MAG: C39 family peptidase [Pseudanabaenaceae cyanobacterium bins.39]|nr:C39 family peptidase [Pseudanabaenaceae cyanobacterium bins.39]
MGIFKNFTLMTSAIALSVLAIPPSANLDQLQSKVVGQWDSLAKLPSHENIFSSLPTPDLSAFTKNIAEPSEISEQLESSSQIVAWGNVSAIIRLPDTGVQNDSWSCGPNSVARVLRYYGHNVNYAGVRDVTDRQLLLPQRFRNPLTNQWVEIRTGTPPLTLQKVMQRWEGRYVKQSVNTDLSRLVQLVRSGKPAIALIRVGSLRMPYVGAIPYLHWVTITGADPQQQLIYYTDTNSQSYQLSYNDFARQWDLGLGQDISTAIANVLKNHGVQARTIVWVDRLR